MTTLTTSVLAAAAQTGGAGEDMVIHTWEWIVLAAIILVLITVDIVGHVRTPHEPTIKESAIWSVAYIALALLFGVYMWAVHGPTFGGEYFAGYITEKALSIDNLFVFVIIIAAFKVPRAYQQKVLLYGIVMAMVMRLVFILIGAAIIERFVAVFFLFGAFLIWTAIQQARQGVEDPADHDAEGYEENGFVRFMRKRFPVTEGFVGQKLIHRHGGKTYMTPLLLCIMAIGSADLMFAVDSIPAVYGLTSQPFIVFAANAFSLLGLRQLYFLIDGLLDRLIYLHYGLAAILGFIGVKLVIHAINGTFLADSADHLWEPSIGFSLAFIVGVLAITVIASLRSKRGRAMAQAKAHAGGDHPREEGPDATVAPTDAAPIDAAPTDAPAGVEPIPGAGDGSTNGRPLQDRPGHVDRPGPGGSHRA